jgi:hypothetical protein
MAASHHGRGGHPSARARGAGNPARDRPRGTSICAAVTKRRGGNAGMASSNRDSSDMERSVSRGAFCRHRRREGQFTRGDRTKMREVIRRQACRKTGAPPWTSPPRDDTPGNVLPLFSHHPDEPPSPCASGRLWSLLKRSSAISACWCSHGERTRRSRTDISCEQTLL